VRRFAGLAHELDAARLVHLEVAPGVIGIKEQEHAAAGLVADA